MTVATDTIRAREVVDTEEQFGVPAGTARARGGLWLIELSDGTYVTSFGDRLHVFLAAPLPVDDVEAAELVARSTYCAERIVPRVRANDDSTAVWAELSTLTGQELVALVVTLAAMVPDDRTTDELLAWTDGLVRP